MREFRTVPRKRETLHYFIRRLQERLQPERNLPFDIVCWQSNRLALPVGTLSRCLPNIVAVSLPVLHRVRGAESVARGILNQPDEHARAIRFYPIPASLIVASQFGLYPLPQVPRNDGFVFARIHSFRCRTSPR